MFKHMRTSHLSLNQRLSFCSMPQSKQREEEKVSYGLQTWSPNYSCIKTPCEWALTWSQQAATAATNMHSENECRWTWWASQHSWKRPWNACAPSIWVMNPNHSRCHKSCEIKGWRAWHPLLQNAVLALNYLDKTGQPTHVFMFCHNKCCTSSRTEHPPWMCCIWLLCPEFTLVTILHNGGYFVEFGTQAKEGGWGSRWECKSVTVQQGRYRVSRCNWGCPGSSYDGY